MDSHIYKFEGEQYKIYYPMINNSSVVKALLKNKIWERNIQDLFRKYINKNHSVLEIGPYIGTHTILLSKLAKKVIAVEPCLLTYNCLKNTLNNNNNLNNVAIYPIAAYSQSCELDFGTSGDGDSSIIKYRRKKFKENYLVKAEPLDNIVFDENIRLIKIDAEGSEFEALKGCDAIIQINRPIIIIEIWTCKNRLELLDQFLTDYNYSANYLGGDNYILRPN